MRGRSSLFETGHKKAAEDTIAVNTNFQLELNTKYKHDESHRNTTTKHAAKKL